MSRGLSHDVEKMGPYSEPLSDSVSSSGESLESPRVLAVLACWWVVVTVAGVALWNMGPTRGAEEHPPHARAISSAR